MQGERPTDLQEVRQALADLLAAGRDEEALDAVVSLLDQLRSDNAALALRIKQLLRRDFGRRSEKIDSRQLALFLEQAAAAGATTADGPAPPTEDPPPRRRRRTPTGRKPLPASLPREKVIHEPDAEDAVCETCGAPKERIGEERSEVLEWVPGQFKVIEHVRIKRACRRCQDGVVIAPPADKVIEGGLPGPGLMAQVLVSKYRDHLPLHRLAGIFRRAGVELADSTLGNWVKEGAELLEPLADRIFDRVMAAHVVQADDTGLRVLDKDHPEGVRKGHIWGFVGDRRLVAFKYTPTWDGSLARAFFIGRRGWVQSDAYAGFNKMFAAEAQTGLREVGCWAHARRKWVEALEAGDVRAAVPVALIRKLYAVERKATAEGMSAEARLTARQAESAPVLEELRTWIEGVRGRAPPKTPLGKALGYTSNQWEALSRFLEDGRLELDNNGVERALRAIAVGRRNWLFAGSAEGANRAAILYTVFGSCALVGVEPWAYVRDVLDKLSGDFPAKRLTELLPDAWAEANPQHALAPAPPGVEDDAD